MRTFHPTRRHLVLGFVALAACGGARDPVPYRTALTAPWTAMALPIGDARVVYSDDAMVTIHHDGGDTVALTAAYAGAIEAAGMKRGSDASGTDMASITFSDPTAVVALGVLGHADRVEVSLTRYPR